MTPSLSCVHIHSLSSDWEKCMWLSKYFELVSVCFCVPFHRRSLLFLIRVFPFLSLILCYSYFGTFLSTWSMYVCIISQDLSVTIRSWGWELPLSGCSIWWHVDVRWIVNYQFYCQLTLLSWNNVVLFSGSLVFVNILINKIGSILKAVMTSFFSMS